MVRSIDGEPDADATPWFDHNVNGDWRTIEEDQPAWEYAADTVRL